jgi:hypothetical protein
MDFWLCLYGTFDGLMNDTPPHPDISRARARFYKKGKETRKRQEENEEEEWVGNIRKQPVSSFHILSPSCRTWGVL